MSNKYLFLTLILAFLSLNTVVAQCTIDATVESNPSSYILTTNGNPKQSFVPCISGDVSSLKFQVTNATQSGSGTLSIIEGEGVGSLVASVAYGDITFTDTGYTIVDLSDVHVPVDAGRIYSISFSIVSNLRYHRYDDVYSDGGRYVGSTRVSDNDIVFELSIDPATDYFVNGSTGSDSNDGSDFANAFATIKKATDTATPGSNIYVAAGTYLPTAGFDFDESGSIDAREFTFHIPTGYTLYGGFDGTETTIDLNARDFATNETILSGDLGAAGISDNAYHVVYTDNVSSNTLLNGFTIQDGNANGSSGTPNTVGGGWYNDGSDGKMSSPQAVNLIIRNNTASNAGGFFNGGDAGTANPIFRSCVFDSNDATTGYGGAFYNSSLSTPIEANPAFYNCTFISNTSGHSGAAIASFGSGGGDFVNFEIVNSIFYENVAATPQFPSFNTAYLSQSDMSLHHSIFDDSSLPSGTIDDGDNLVATNPLFASEGGYELSNCSPAANAGDNSVVTESLDASGNVRLQNATVDIGAFEFTDPSQPEISTSQSTIDFGGGNENQILQETIIISNTTGFGDLSIMASIDGDAAFSINTAPSTILEGATADLIIDYAPTGIYNQFAEVLIESNDCTQESITIDLSGEGVFTPIYTLAHGEPYQLGTLESNSIRYITSLNNSLVHGMFISADGTKVHVLRSNSVFQMSMSTPFDITTASDDGSFSISGEVSDATAMAFDPIGMRLFILAGTDLFQYSLTSAFDVMGTVSYDGSIAIPHVGQLPTGITFNQKGDRMLILDNDQDRIQNYQLEFPYDIINGALTASSNSIISSDFSVPQDLQLSANEKEIFVVEDGKLIQYRAFSNVNGIFPNNIGEKEIPFSSTFTADAKAIHYTPDSKHLFILQRTTTGSVRIRQLSFEREQFDEESINDGSLSGSAELFLTGTTFVNAGSSLVEGTHFSVTNLPNGLTPEVDISADGETATLTLGGKADDNQSIHDVDDLSIIFTDAAFDGVAADDIDVLGNNEYHVTFRDNDITWDGSFDTNWSDARNWSPGRVPNINENAIIPTISSSFNRSPIIDNDQEINNLELSSISATVTLTEGKSLAIYGTVSGSGSLITSRAVEGNLGYSVIGATVTDQTVADLTPNADVIYAYDGVSNVYSVPTVLDEGNGYFVAFDESSPTITLSGKPVSGEVTRTVVFTANGQSDDFELVANPYNAAITRQSFVEENGPIGTGVIDGTIYLWQDGGANLPNGTRAGSYLTVNASGTATGGSFDGYIRSGQGFFVAANSTIENTLSFSPSMQTLDTDANTTDGFFRKSEQKMNISIAGNDLQDELILEFVEGASLQIDAGYDALKLMNSGLSFYSMMGETPLAIQALPLFKQELMIPIGLNVSVAGEYVISVSEMEGFPNEEMILVDLYTNQEYQLSSDSQIKLTLDEGKEESRFVLVSQPSTVLGTNDQLIGLNIQRFNTGIQITYESTKNSDEVSIYTLSGTRIINQELDFKSGEAFIEMDPKEDQVYILHIGDTSVKFVFK